MTEIVAHRGWDGRNSPEGIIAAISNKHGAEFDLRDDGVDIVIAHDPFPRHAVRFDELLYRLQCVDLINRQVLAINIKSAGLAPRLSEIILDRRLTNYFCFDLASPDAAEYRAQGLRFLDRCAPQESSACWGACGTIYDFVDTDPEFFYKTELYAEEEVRFVVCPSMRGLDRSDFLGISPRPTHILRRFY